MAETGQEDSMHLLQPADIISSIHAQAPQEIVQINDIKFTVFPDVFPSQHFRSTKLMLDSLLPLVQNQVVIDMGCGFGVMGLSALHYGASASLLVDINRRAVENTAVNRDAQGFTKEQARIFLSDCFDSVPPTLADLIVFNPPFHSDEPVIPVRPIELAFFDPQSRTLAKFLAQARSHSHPGTRIFIAFSDKGNVDRTEELFTHHVYSWELWRRANTDSRYDSRLYMLEKLASFTAEKDGTRR